VRVDGSETDFSYSECLLPASIETKVQRAFRVAIEPDVFKFKQSFFDGYGDGCPVCPFTGEPLTFVGAHVDHAPPGTFRQLFNEFLSFAGCNVHEIQLREEEDNSFQEKLIDQKLKDAWVQFHRERAQLRVVSRTANLSLLRRQN
jgi:hypothetical protein